MNYEIYFDEANKLDQPTGGYSYYGAYGSESEKIVKLTEGIEKIFADLRTSSELHFVKYTKDTNIKKYFKVLNYLMEQDFCINIFIVNNDQAKITADKMNVDLSIMRSLFYVKIPERLFYGITRSLTSGTDISLFVDANDEYDKLDLYSKLKEQMNAHSAYRNKCYKITEATSLDSKESIPLQIIDTIIGVVVFLFEKSYLEQSDIASIKSDLIYRFLIEDDNIEKIQQRLTLFKWDNQEDQITSISIGDYISNFLVYKTQEDIKAMNKLKELMIKNVDLTRVSDYRKLMEYKNTQHRIIQGYIDEILYNDRNYSLR
ncbi:DUF3800 domain-containing protein [Priestia aryabhattai]|uniref:DUF3800 domain-containing protein n=1 Tax=Priestia aryabhattai TaxID=412384 RepID=UPI0027E487BA|nr:DUF3800 domain-containing protein [Priestia aryabhattai]MCG0050439.1 hypothetical protein [Priestia aryabhattai]